MQQLALTCDGAMDLGAILQFNGNSLMAEFHQKPIREYQRTTLQAFPKTTQSLSKHYASL